jgi:hypothetical protein
MEREGMEEPGEIVAVCLVERLSKRIDGSHSDDDSSAFQHFYNGFIRE